MSKHTPGPWEDQGSCSSGHEIKAKVAHIGEGAITLFHAPNMRDVSFNFTKEGELWGLLCYEQYVQFPSKAWEGMQEANVRLITAAPELLVACKEFVRKVECGEARSKRSYAQMKAAIAKAEDATLQQHTEEEIKQAMENADVMKHL